MFIAAHRPRDRAIGTILDLTIAWNAFVVCHVEPVVEGACFADLGISVALVTLLDPAGQIVAPLVPVIKVETWLALVTIIDA